MDFCYEPVPKIHTNLSVSVYLISRGDQEQKSPAGRKVDHYEMEENHLEVKANSVIAHLTFVQIPTGVSVTKNLPLQKY